MLAYISVRTKGDDLRREVCVGYIAPKSARVAAQTTHMMSLCQDNLPALARRFALYKHQIGFSKVEVRNHEIRMV